MDFTAHVLTLKTRQQVKAVMAQIGCDPIGMNIMLDKAIFTTIKMDKIPAKAANLLKQTFLAKGGEVVIARGTADLTVEFTDVLVCATCKQYIAALAQLKLQPWGLPQVAAAIEEALEADRGFPAREYHWPGCSLSIQPGRTLVMGILNVTPDSFSDGGKYNILELALHRAEQLIADGADILDIGAESTRPYGAEKITAAEELQRLLPILEKVVEFSPVPISVDTYKAKVAKEALKAGAHIINDIWGLQGDQAMAQVAAEYKAPIILMHNQRTTEYARDIIAEILDFLNKSMEIALKAGVAKSQLIIDPGIGFGKDAQQNLAVLARMAELKALGCPILLGTSRKRFIGHILGGLPPEERGEGTAATVALGIANQANIVRVHDVKQMVQVARITDAILGGVAHD